ncbi:prepilin-type N-terminal cleavage/methylation domain-containing protein [Variovorax sp. J22R24]|uniref:PilW family protein n=1 Tax=Variovorax gracilis TaxID=3053502 RepID=UPI0025777C77|nr:prepilin-type N-terminal cleavage/methylation domain-containing protein [Variovorax sp. J22R24]MDM0103936.1 prepilin-type N-terminal cleavage/methylation domain-containing protein [Variovorax sp. J22R24]
MPSPEFRASGRNRQRGLSLVELLVAMTVGLMVVVAAVGALALSRAASSDVSDLSQLQQQGSYALHVIGTQIRHAGSVDPVRDDATGLYAFVKSPVGVGSANAMVFGADGKGTQPDSVSVAFAPASIGTSDLGPSAQYDCAGTRVDEADRVVATFEVAAQGQLRCAGESQKQPVIANVADLQIDYRVETEGGIQTMDADEVEGRKLWGAVTAIEVCLDLQGDEIGADLDDLYKACGNADKPRDGRVHLVFRNVFSLRTH